MQASKLFKPINIYLTTIIATGSLISFFILWNATSLMLTWDLLVIFTIALLLLTHNMILLPPKGNSLSMDSAVYLGCLLLFGITTTIQLLVITTIAYNLLTRDIAWWKHLFNLSNYTLMLFGANLTFQLLNGIHGLITPTNIFIYMVALSVYYVLNVVVIGAYFYLNSNDEFAGIYRSIIEDSLFSYLIMLILSLVLVFLLKTNVYIGILLFCTITLLLSRAFKQYFNLYQQITEKANTDHLTGLYNHGYFKEVLEEKVNESIKTGHSLSLAMIDLDGFKRYNDTFGHIQGDNLLEFVGQFIKKECQKDDIVARYGGEEFVILMPNTAGQEAFKRMNRLRKKMNDTHFEGVEVLPYGCISYSGGVIEYENGTTQDFLQRADKALYIAKSKGKNLIIPPSELSKETKSNDETFDEKLAILHQQVGIFLKKDLTTFRHSKQVYEYSKLMAERLDLSDVEKEQLILGALIHDIGKVEIPRDMLTKTTKLTDYEWSTIKKHVVWGKEWIESIDGLQELIPLIELHHERFDGNGYPYGLSGKTIPKLARILCIIDSFDAMTTERPYQATRTFEDAIEELRRCSGTQFDPEFVEPFIEMISEMYLTTEKKAL